MKYLINVVITDPNTPEGMISELYFKLEAHFFYDEEQYGNKHYLSITGKDFSMLSYDIRYDTSFRSDNKILYLIQWATNYWSGKDGAWKIKSIEIKELSQ